MAVERPFPGMAIVIWPQEPSTESEEIWELPGQISTTRERKILASPLWISDQGSNSSSQMLDDYAIPARTGGGAVEGFNHS